MAPAGAVTTGIIMQAARLETVLTSSASSLSCGLGEGGLGVEGASLPRSSHLMACPVSLSFRKNRTVKIMNSFPVTLLMAKNHNPLLG